MALQTMSPAATTAIPAGSRVTVELSGALPSYLPDSIFREDFGNQLRMQGLNVETLTISSGYGLTSRDYKATAVLTTLAPNKVSGVLALVTSAAENARSYTPNVTMPSVGMAEQPNVQQGTITKTIDDIITALGTAAKGVADAPDQLFSTTKLIVIGIVVIAAVVAFGPNLRGIGRAVR